MLPWWRRLARGLAISGVTLLLLFILLEVGVRCFVPAETFRAMANVFVPHPDPAIAFTIEPGYRGHAFGVPLASNRWGYRGADWAEAKPEGTVRIGIVGDSHAFAYGVPFEQGFGEQLAQKLAAHPGLGKKVEVLNFSLPGYNTRQEAAVLERIALRFDLDLAMVVYCSNDHLGAFVCDDTGWLYSRPTGEEGPLVRNDSWRERSFISFQRSVFGNSRLLLWMRIQWLRFRYSQQHEENMQRYSGTAPIVPTTAEIAAEKIPAAIDKKVYQPLRRMAQACKQRRVPFVFASILGGARGAVLAARLEQEFGAPSVDFTAQFPEVRSYLQLMQEFSLGWDPHLNGAAHDRWADACLRTIVAQQLIPGVK